MTRPIRRSLVAVSLVFSVVFWAAGGDLWAAKGDPKPLDPTQTLKPAGTGAKEDGYFDDVFGLDRDGTTLAVIRTDGANFAKLEIFDAATAKLTTTFDLPGNTLVPVMVEPVAGGKGAVLVARDKPDDAAPVYAYAFATGKPVVKVGPATSFERPPADGTARAGLLVAIDRKLGPKGTESPEATYTLTPYHFATLAAAGKAKVHKIDATGQLTAPALRFVGFFDGYTRILGERPGAYDKSADVRKPSRRVVIDALGGKISSEGEIADVPGWAVTNLLRRQHPGRSLFVELNQDGSGVDVVDAMGKQHPAELPVPFRQYDAKSLLVEEGPAPGALAFGITRDPLNPDAIKRQKADLPMLDVYKVDAEPTHDAGKVTLRARIFTPRPITWRTRADKLVVLKRFKSFSRGGDELQIFALH
jgi:hypothetical protein